MQISNLITIDNLRSLKRDVLIREASFWVGTREVTENDGELIRMFQSVIGTATRESWCMSFVQFCVNKTDVLIGNEAYSKMALSENCMEVWNNTPAEARFSEPEPGRVAIWQFDNTRMGHCGIVEKLIDSSLFQTIEGNTVDSDEIVRNGDGVFRRRRSIASTKKFQLRGFIDPWAGP